MQNFIIVLYVMSSDTRIIGIDINLHVGRVAQSV